MKSARNALITIVIGTFLVAACTPVAPTTKEIMLEKPTATEMMGKPTETVSESTKSDTMMENTPDAMTKPTKSGDMMQTEAWLDLPLLNARTGERVILSELKGKALLKGQAQTIDAEIIEDDGREEAEANE